MNRKYVMVCSFFCAFFVLSLLCYVSFRHASNLREDSEDIEVTETAGESEARVTGDTKYIVEKYEEESEELIKEERDVPAKYAGLTREELEHELAVEMATISWEEEEEGLVSMTLKSFSKDQIVIRKVYNSSKKEGYLLKLEGGEVVVYQAKKDELYERTGILEEDLSEDDRELLREGYEVTSEKELYSILENFSS